MAKGVDDKLDLVLERVIKAPRALVWRCWTEPELVKKWFTPKPVVTTSCEIDLRPGGRFNTAMRLPDGTEHTGLGCYLEVVDGERLVFTDALTEGWRPNALPFMAAFLSFKDHADGTKYRAHIKHADAEARDRHQQMGFEHGWGIAAEQLEELAQGLLN